MFDRADRKTPFPTTNHRPDSPMACFQHHNHQSRTCCCNTPPPPLPSPAVDPILLQSIVSQLFQNPQTAHLYSAAPTAAATDFHPSSYQYLQQRIQKLPKQKQSQSHRQPFEDQFHSDLAFLLQRIDVLESALNRFSPAATFSLRHVAARTIQIHFRAHLVRRSRALSELKELASIKSALNILKSFVSLQKRIDFFALSYEALDLISRLETIQSGDQMVRDSKRSIRREISGFLELIDEICAKRTVSVKTVKHIRMAGNDARISYAGRDGSGVYHRNKPSKQPNVDSDEKRQINKLRERVERIQHISKGLINEEDSVDSDDDNGSGAYQRGKYSKQGNMGSNKKKLIDNLRERVDRIQHLSKGLKDEDVSADSDVRNDAIDSKIYGNGKQRSVSEKHVWFAENGNTHENGEVPMKKAFCNAERREDSVDNQHEEDGELESDMEEDGAESTEGNEFEDEERSGSLESSSQGSEGGGRRKCFAADEDTKVKPSYTCEDGKLFLSAPSPVKMEGRVGSQRSRMV